MNEKTPTLNPSDFTPLERDALIKALLNFQSPPPEDFVDPEITMELIQASSVALAKLGVTWTGTVNGVSCDGVVRKNRLAMSKASEKYLKEQDGEVTVTFSQKEKELMISTITYYFVSELSALDKNQVSELQSILNRLREATPFEPPFA